MINELKWELNTLKGFWILNGTWYCSFAHQSELIKEKRAKLVTNNTCKSFFFMYSHILFTTSARDSVLSPVPINFIRASESGRGARSPEPPPFFGRFSSCLGSSESEQKNVTEVFTILKGRVYLCLITLYSLRYNRIKSVVWCAVPLLSGHLITQDSYYYLLPLLHLPLLRPPLLPLAWTDLPFAKSFL